MFAEMSYKDVKTNQPYIVLLGVKEKVLKEIYWTSA